MFFRRKERKAPQPLAGTAAVPASEAEQVRALLARGNTKSAVEVAKGIHKRYGSLGSEALLVDAYAARIRSLLDHGLATEAKALLEMVRERFSSAKGKLDDVGIAVAVTGQSSLDDLLRPLLDPAIPEERRMTIENVIKRRVSDLSALAKCPTLPPDHPLRAGAAALQKALEAVTCGPVPDDALLLPEVSRRGPLAPWKLLVRAIAYLYRPDDASCERCLQGIDPDSAPARIVPAIRVMLGAPNKEPLPPAAVNLVRQVGGSVDALRGALESLDAAFAAKADHKIFTEIQRAIAACRTACPEILERLQQHISIRALTLKLPVRRVKGAMGGPSIKNAYFWRLYARSAENQREGLSPITCSLWEEFRRHAMAEGWFAPDGPEAAALYLHMAEQLQWIPHEELSLMQQSFMARFPGHGHYYDDQPPAIRAAALKGRTPDFYYLFPEQLHRRACAIDPHPEAFEKWLSWASQHTDWKMAEEAAEAWRQALPNDSRPLLHLMEAAEKRDALKKAMSFLEGAEKLDALNPEVRRARIRLLVRSAIRHLRQRKVHLAEKELEALESLPQAQEGDRPAFLSALRWVSCVIQANNEGIAQQFKRTSDALDGEVAAALTCDCVGEECRLSSDELYRYLKPKAYRDQKGSVAGAVARACSLGDDMNVRFGIPAYWEDQVFEELAGKDCALDARQLRALAEAALRLNQRELAYAASTAGLAKSGATEARFLLLRAQALPGWEFERRSDCIAAAAELGRRQRDMALVDEAVELKRGGGTFGLDFLDFIESADQQAFSMTTEKLNAVLKREKGSTEFNTYGPPPGPFRGPFADGPYFNDEPDDEEAMDFEPTFEDVAQLLLEMTKAAGKRKRPKKGRRGFEADSGELPF